MYVRGVKSDAAIKDANLIMLQLTVVVEQIMNPVRSPTPYIKIGDGITAIWHVIAKPYL